MITDEERKALADMLVRCGIERGVLGRIDADNVARILLPVVEAIARRRAAAVLRTAADEAADPLMPDGAWVPRLRARADALDSQ